MFKKTLLFRKQQAKMVFSTLLALIVLYKTNVILCHEDEGAMMKMVDDKNNNVENGNKNNRHHHHHHHHHRNLQYMNQVVSYQPNTAYKIRGGSEVITNDNGRPGYTGNSYINFGDDGSYVEWNDVVAHWDGQYKITFRYAATGRRRCKLIINGIIRPEEVSFLDTGGWKFWMEEEPIFVTLQRGKNTIRLESIGMGPNLDKMDVSPSLPSFLYDEDGNRVEEDEDNNEKMKPSPTLTQSVTYLAIETTNSKNVKFSTSSLGGYTSPAFLVLGDDEDEVSSYIEWDNVIVDGDGEYEINIHYSTNTDDSKKQSFNLIVKNEEKNEEEESSSSSYALSFQSTDGSNNWKNEIITVSLLDGRNKIRIESINNDENDSGPNIDKMVIQLALLHSNSPSSSLQPTSKPSKSPSPTNSQRPSISPTVSPSFIPTNQISISPSTSNPTFNPTAPRTNQSFQIKMYWKREYMWQDKTKPRAYCMTIMKKNDMLEIKDCNERKQEQRWYYDSGRIISAKKSNMCLSSFTGNRRALRLYPCGYNTAGETINQKWYNFKKYGRFQLRPVSNKATCVTQHHQPRPDELLYLHDCLQAYKDKTSFWEIGYWHDHKDKGRRYSD